MYDRNRSKKVELLARCRDHSSTGKRFYKGFQMLTLGWSDGATFMPVDFALLSSKKAQMNGISEQIDKRTSGYKRRIEALEIAPSLVPNMIDRALQAGVTAQYVLMGSWFTHAPLVQSVIALGMVKPTKQHYLVNDRSFSLKELYNVAMPVQGPKDILHSIQVTLKNGVPVKIVFIQNRNKKSE